MKDRFIRFMAGRYGMDQLSNFLVWFSLVMAVMNLFANSTILWLLTLVSLIFAYIRMFSKNYDRCRKQNYWFLNKTGLVRSKYKKYVSRLKTLKTHHIYTCSKCRQKIRIPRGRGKVMIRCPKCGNEFIKNS